MLTTPVQQLLKFQNDKADALAWQGNENKKLMGTPGLKATVLRCGFCAAATVSVPSELQYIFGHAPWWFWVFLVGFVLGLMPCGKGLRSIWGFTKIRGPNIDPKK